MSDIKQARALVEAVRRDLMALFGMVDEEIFANEIFGFHVQQAAEKLCKAWLALKGRPTLLPTTWNPYLTAWQNAA